MRETVVITDTSCLIVLSRIGMLVVLRQLYSNIVVTKEIADEFGEPLPDWIEVKQVPNKKYQLLLEATLDKGESSAIALAIDLPDSLLIVDDLKGRKEARRLGLKITGTLGVLYSAKQHGFINELEAVVRKLEEHGFRLSSEIKKAILG